MILHFVVYVERSEYKRRVCEKSCAGVVKTLVIKTLVQHVGTPTQVPVTLTVYVMEDIPAFVMYFSSQVIHIYRVYQFYDIILSVLWYKICV